MSHAAARAALNTYVATSHPREGEEARDVQARDLIVDLLLMFEAETAARILVTAEQNYLEEEPTVTPVYIGV
ncbi:hypothetical protein ABZ565_33015 [Streptomyces sp. NPDC016469]|uniref:hypothetical protein n=1 Tax=Streptomyces sp. NPDC016469 TaxID=3157191 RepID=UPI0033D7ECB7